MLHDTFLVIDYWLLNCIGLCKNWHEAMKKLQKLIGDLEIMVAAAEPGIVMTENMSVSCSVTLLTAVEELRKVLQQKRGESTP